MWRKSLIFIWCFLHVSCNQENNQAVNQNKVPTKNEKIFTEIQYQEAKIGGFSARQFLQGKLKARRKATIKSEITGVISQLQIRDGDYISKGSILLHTDDGDLLQDRAMAVLDLDDALVKKRERLVMDGGEVDNDTSVPADKLKMIHTMTGYDKALQSIKQIDYRIGKTKLMAPLSGVVTDLRVYPYEMISVGETICTIISPESFELEFYAIESLAMEMKKGQMITLHPLTDDTKKVQAQVHIINPVVDDNGMVEIRARLNKHNFRFFENMNMRVILEQPIPDVIVIPKEALVIRSGKEVVFTYDQVDSRAKWNYVTVLDQNDTYLAISNGLSAGDLVIIDGNLSLDHDAQVTLQDSLNIQ